MNPGEVTVNGPVVKGNGPKKIKTNKIMNAIGIFFFSIGFIIIFVLCERISWPIFF